MLINPIGYVKSEVIEQKDHDWSSTISHIIITPEYAEGLSGLSEFSHIIVIYHLHQAEFNPARDLIRRPQGRENMPMIGIFAQRAKNRPNPIGITAVKLLAVENNIITVEALDAIDETPILDIKPYYPQYDLKDNVIVPQWVNILMEQYF